MSGLTLHFSVQSAGIEGWRGPHYGAADCSSGYYKGSSLAATDIFSPELTIKAIFHGSGTERDGCKTHCCSCSAPVGQLWMLIYTSVLADLRLPRILHFPLLLLFFSPVFLSVLYSMFSVKFIMKSTYCDFVVFFDFISPLYLQWSDHRLFPYMTVLKQK